MVLFFSEEVEKPGLVELVCNSISDSFELEIELLLLVIIVSMAGDVYDLWLPSHHLFETFKVDGLLANLKVLARTLQDLYESTVLQVRGQLIAACGYQLELLGLIIIDSVYKWFTVKVHQVWLIIRRNGVDRISITLSWHKGKFVSVLRLLLRALLVELLRVVVEILVCSGRYRLH
jgi:hypothetical protein